MNKQMIGGRIHC